MYEFIFKADTIKQYKNGITLPIAPQSITLEVNGKNETMNLLNGGEINIIKRPGLKTVTFDAFLPDAPLPFAYYPDYFHGSQYYIDFIKTLSNEIHTNKIIKYFDFYVLRNQNGSVSVDVSNISDTLGNNIYTYGAEPYYSMKCSVDSYTLKEEAKEGRGVTVSIKLKEYREASTSKLKLTHLTDGTPVYIYENNRETNRKGGTQYTVKKGDSLWSIAKQQLGNQKWAEVIYDLNKKTIEVAAVAQGLKSSSKMIFTGTVLNLPHIT